MGYAVVPDLLSLVAYQWLNAVPNPSSPLWHRLVALCLMSRCIESLAQNCSIYGTNSRQGLNQPR